MRAARKWVLAVVLIVTSITCPVAKAGHFVDGFHGQDPICRALVRRLNKYHPSNHCIWDVISTFSGFKDPPWQELDPKAHKALLAELIRYRGEGPDGYFKLKPNATLLATEKRYLKAAQYFIDVGGRLELWRARLLDYSGLEPMPQGQQAVVQMRYPINKTLNDKVCSRVPRTKWDSSTAVAILTDELEGPDPHVSGADARLMGTHSVFLYKGRLYLVSPSNVWDVSHGLRKEVCSFKYANGKSEEN